MPAHMKHNLKHKILDPRFPKNLKNLISNINLICTYTHVAIQDR